MSVSDAPQVEEQGNPGPGGLRRPDTKLTRHQRVGSARVFRQAFDSRRQFAGRYLVMWLSHGDDASLRLGVVASKATFRKSVDRNRARRLLREAYRLNRYRLGGRKDVILVARRAILRASRQEVEVDLLAMAGRAGLLTEKQP